MHGSARQDALEPKLHFLPSSEARLEPAWADRLREPEANASVSEPYMLDHARRAAREESPPHRGSERVASAYRALR